MKYITLLTIQPGVQYNTARDVIKVYVTHIEELETSYYMKLISLRYFVKSTKILNII